MFPIGDDNTSRRTVPLVTFALITMNILFFLVEMNGGDAFIMKWSFVPSRFLANPIGDFPTLFTSMFMHAGWLHLGGNMLYLWIFGDNVEDRFGHAKFTIFYLLCGLGATFAQLAFSLDSNIPNLGASGAIAGVLGAYILMFPQGRVRVLQGQRIIQVPALIVIGAVAGNYSAKREAGLLAARYGASAGVPAADSAPLQSLNLDCAVSMA